jgi:hypothetical protein
METKKLTKQFEFLGEEYAVTKYLGPKIIEIAILKDGRFGKSKYEIIYCGHIDPIKEAINFFESI